MPIKNAAAAAVSGSGVLATYSLACVGGLAPFALMLPANQDRLEAQTAKWAPRWEKGVNRLTPSVERGVKRIEPPIARAVQKIPEKLPLERAAKAADSRIRRGIDRIERHNKRVEVSVRMV